MAATLTTAEIAAAHRVSVRTAQRWAQQGKVQATKQAGRWVISVPAQLDDYKPHQIDNARDAIEQGAILPTSRPGIYTAVSSDGTTHYLVAEESCTCPAGTKGRYRCYHRAAVALLEAARTRRAA
ncbi:helix-turn-helix domain-containing protein [Actinomadura sp. ATCC 31491]|uniref:Helix-turn-helix domain-containing protein n=1 Tax=Actinomadura luzonensis TaxID=2805427 RepID=A0ABT0G537_9ACTN|nr:helix-turn-helix domain-containing protein [Actinomadura luzonensis]MCK2219717.1 helix-turn-helix domain-containing protein [Actinomadura luzonensis]